MSKIVDELRAEHAAMARLLDALERQVTLFREGGSPDYDIVQGVIEYFCDFPDLYHHPKEDLLARWLLDQEVEGADALRGLAAQHEELGGLTRRFAKVVQRVLDEAELPRQVFLRTAREFLESQRLHMQMEEKHFLPLAEAHLAGQNLELFEQAVFRRQDPLFGAESAERYARLRDDILDWERAAGEAG